LNSSSNLPRRALATGVAACAHLVVLLLLGWKIPRLVIPSPTEDGNPAIELSLIRPEIRLRGRSPPARARSAPSAAAAAARILTAPAPRAPPASPPAEATPAPVPPNLETNPDGDNVRKALRGLLSCTSVMAGGLSREERETCDRRLASAQPAPVAKSYSSDEVARFNSDKQESILTRKPVNGCLPRLGDHPRPAIPGGAPAPGGPKGRAASTAVGVGCGWSF
jgi:hypothetical protein